MNTLIIVSGLLAFLSLILTAAIGLMFFKFHVRWVKMKWHMWFADHYIKTIEITKMGKVIETRQFTSQTDNSTQKSDFTLTDVKPGETIAIVAQCNIYGKRKVELKL